MYKFCVTEAPTELKVNKAQAYLNVTNAKIYFNET